MHVFDYRFLRSGPLDHGIAERAINIELMRARCELSPCADVNEALRRKAMIMSVADSNEIEGIRTSEGRLMGILTDSLEPLGHDECEIAGYRDALRYIYENHDVMELSKNLILEIYGILMRYSDRNPPGFKERDNVIVERSRSGDAVRVHQTVPAEDTERCIDQLVAAYWEVRDDIDVNKLLLIPCFIMDFLCIHPFRDGNGRMSRLLTTLLLYQEGYGICRYASMESKINSGKGDYYAAIERSEEGWSDGKCDYVPFMSYFLSQLFLCYRDYGMMMGKEMGRSRRSNPLKVFLCSCPIPVSKADLLSMFPELSETTVERVLSDMCRSGDIRMIGGRRNARYVAGEKNLLSEYRIE